MARKSTATKAKATETTAKKAKATKTTAKDKATETVVKRGRKPGSKTKIAYPEKYTAVSLAQYLSQKHELTRKKAKDIMDDLYAAIDAGVMQGERVPIGKIGKIFIKVKPARKSRKGRNPRTGEEITIPAKKASKVPKFSFSKTYKESVTKAKTKRKSSK